jgi:hypothetical protein
VPSKFWCDLVPDVQGGGTGQRRVQDSAKYGNYPFQLRIWDLELSSSTAYASFNLARFSLSEVTYVSDHEINISFVA